MSDGIQLPRFAPTWRIATIATMTPPKCEKIETGVISLLTTMSTIQGGRPRICQKTAMRIRNGLARNNPTASIRFEM